MTPLLSIIIPCYNQSQFLDQALQSVFNQTYLNWECIIINDGSTDHTEEIANEWVSKDNRFIYFYKENRGVSSARNFGLEKVNGKYLQFLDSDDLLDSRKLELSLLYLSKSHKENEKLVISDFRMVSSDSKITNPYCKLHKEIFNFESLLYKWNESFSIPIHCGFFKTSLFENIRFPENLSAQEDWIVWVKIFKLDVKAIFIAEPLAIYRQNPESRMMTKSIFTDQMLAYESFKTILTESEFHRLSEVLISRYYREQEMFKNRLNGVKKSKVYQTGLLIKKILKAVRLLNFFKNLFPIVLKLKSK